jgi:hypothetical protein
MKNKNGLCLFTLVAAFSLGTTSYAGGYPVAGENPSQRPAGAPIIKEFSKNDAWYEQALYGIQKPAVIPTYASTRYPDPYTGSLRLFLLDQGGWYNPFTRPGMVGYYDIRSWHVAKK